MDTPRSDHGRLPQESETALSKKMKMLIIMLSLVLMILLLPLVSNHGLPLLRPMGISLRQRLWDALRFFAMTAAISIGIISTSNSHKINKNHDGSLHHQSSSSFHRPSMAPTTSRETLNLNTTKYNKNIDERSGSFIPHAQRMPEGEDGDSAYEWNAIQMNNTQKSKGKELMKDFPFSTTASSGINSDGADSSLALVQSQSKSFEGEAYEGFKHRPSNSSIVRSRGQWPADNSWLVAPSIDEDVEEDSIERANSITRADLKKTLFASHGKEGSNKENKSVSIGLMNVYNSMTDDNYAELKMRKDTLSKEYHAGEKGKDDRRSSSVDRRRPMYMYDQKGPDQPGLKQILMEMSKERVPKSKMPDSDMADNQRAAERPTNAHAQSASNSSFTPLMQSMKANALHHQASVVSRMKLPSDAPAGEKHADVYIVETNYTKAGSNESLHTEADAGKVGSVQSKQENVFKLAPSTTGKPAVDHNMQQKPADYSQTRSMQQRVDAAMVDSAHESGGREGKFNAKVGSQHKQADGKMGGSQGLGFEDGNMQSYDEVPHNDDVPSTRRLLKQNSNHSRSTMSFEQLGQADQNKQQTRSPVRPSARGRKSFSCDFGDGFNPDWLLELLESSLEGDQQSKSNNAEGRSTDSSSLIQSLVPWRSSAPIDISAYPRAASPLEALSTVPSRSEVNRRADEFISNFNTRLIKQRQESLERQKSTYGWSKVMSAY